MINSILIAGANFGGKNKNIQEQIDNLQVQIVTMTVQLSKMLKQKTGKGLEVRWSFFKIRKLLI